MQFVCNTYMFTVYSVQPLPAMSGGGEMTNIDKDFTRELIGLINKHSIDNELNTADFVLAQYIALCLKGLKLIIKKRSKWHGTP